MNTSHHDFSRLVYLIVLWIGLTVPLGAMSNADVVKMTRADLSESTILLAIERGPADGQLGERAREFPPSLFYGSYSSVGLSIPLTSRMNPGVVGRPDMSLKARLTA